MTTGVRNHSGLSAVSAARWPITRRTTTVGIKKESSLIDFVLGAEQRWMEKGTKNETN